MTNPDLTVPRPVRIVAFNADGDVVKDAPVTGDDILAPLGLAHQLLHVDGVTRTRIYDLESGDLILEQSDPDVVE